MQRNFDFIVFAEREHYLSYSKLPEKDQVQRIFDQHYEDIQKIKSFGSNIEVIVNDYTKDSGFNYSQMNCPAKRDIIILARSGRKAVIEKMGKEYGDNLFGVPYRVLNM